MKTGKIIFVNLILFLIGCQKDINNLDSEEEIQGFSIKKNEKIFDYNNYSREDQLKIVVLQSLNNILVKDTSFAKHFIKENLIKETLR